jgi:hypothetical protein
MKNLIFGLFYLFYQSLPAQGITFETEWKTAVEKATKEKKLIFMHAYNSWYHTSRYFEKSVLASFSIQISSI